MKRLKRSTGVCLFLIGLATQGFSQPSANFTADPLTGEAPLNVQFSNTSRGQFGSSLWEFGDGATSDRKNPDHTYTTPGTYTVKLTVSGSIGSDIEVKNNYITVTGEGQNPNLNPPRNLTRQVAGDRVSLEWMQPAVVDGTPPCDTTLVSYDDGSAEIALTSTTTNVELCVRFTPDSYPATVLGAVFLGGATPPDKFGLVVYLDPDGRNNGPSGQPVFSGAVNVNQVGANGGLFDAPIVVERGDYYVSLMNLRDTKTYAVGLDNNSGDNRRSWIKSGSQTQRLTGTQFEGNLVINALVEKCDGGSATMMAFAAGAQFSKAGALFGMTSEFGTFEQGSAADLLKTASLTEFPALFGDQDFSSVSKALFGPTTRVSGAQPDPPTGYNIYRSGSSPVEISTNNLIHANPNPNDTTFADVAVPAGKHYYVVTAEYAAGESRPSNEVSATIDAGPLPGPRNLTATAVGRDARLQWDPPTGSAATLAVGLATSEVDEIEPNDTPSDAQELSGPSPAIVNGNAEVSDRGSIQINFTDGSSDDLEDLFAVSIGRAGLDIELSGFTSDLDIYLLDNPPTTVLGASTSTGNSEQINDPSLAAGDYLVGVTIFDPAPGGSTSSRYKLKVAGDLPGGGTDGVQAYNIYRSGTPGAAANGSVVGNVPGTTTNFSDTGLNEGTFFYQVTAVTADGESGPSNEASVQIGASTGGKIAVAVGNSQTVGSEFWVDISVSDVRNLFGISFDLGFTNTSFVDLVTPSSSNVVAGSFMGTDVVFAANVDESAGKVSIGISRKSGQGGVDGGGVVARVKFVSRPSTPAGSQSSFSLGSVAANDPGGASIPLAASGAVVTFSSGLTVWPGDTDNNGVVNQSDVLPLGLHWGRTGPPRATTSTSWMGHPAQPWVPERATYADANGDGRVNQVDVLAIGLNWGKTHSMPAALAVSNKTAGAAILRIETIGEVDPGDAFQIKIIAENVNNLFGISFELALAPTNFVQVQRTLAGDFLGSDIVFVENKTDGLISVGMSRKAGQGGVDNSGVIAIIEAVMASTANLGDMTDLTLQNVSANDPGGADIPFDVLNGKLVTDVPSTSVALPERFALHANYPNPFNPETRISFELPQQATVRILVFDLLGRQIRTLVDESLPAGRHAATWDGRDQSGEFVASGLYVYQIQAGRFVEARRMLLLK